MTPEEVTGGYHYNQYKGGTMVFNIGGNWQAFITPAVVVILALIAYFGIFKSIVKAFKLIEIDEQDSAKGSNPMVHTYVIRAVCTALLIVGLSFAYFIAYGPGKKMPPPRESGYMEVLENVEKDTRTEAERKADIIEKKDKTGFLKQVGEPKTLEESKKQSDDYLQKALERAKQREELDK